MSKKNFWPWASYLLNGLYLLGLAVIGFTMWAFAAFNLDNYVAYTLSGREIFWLTVANYFLGCLLISAALGLVHLLSVLNGWDNGLRRTVAHAYFRRVRESRRDKAPAMYTSPMALLISDLIGLSAFYLPKFAIGYLGGLWRRGGQMIVKAAVRPAAPRRLG